MTQDNRIEYWNQRWENNMVAWHSSEVHRTLFKHMDKLCVGGKPKNIFVPLCGKSVDMKWLAAQGISVVGLDAVPLSLEQFFRESSIDWEESSVPSLGPQAKLFSSKDKTVKLYCGDFMELSVDIIGTFDAVWDRASIVAINREDLQRYEQIMKSIVRPGGCMLVELLQYDPASMADVTGPTKPPPPFPMYEKDLKSLYEPEFSVEFVDNFERKIQQKYCLSQTYLLRKS